jgi:putative chitinase
MFTAARMLTMAPGANPVIVDLCAPEFERLAAEHEIDTPLRAAHLMAQLCHESAGFTRLSENLNYSVKRIGQVFPRLKSRANELAKNARALANAAYGGRLGNGDEFSNDGWTFRGRGLIQITGRLRYREAGARIGIDLESSPALAEDPQIAVAVALGYWSANECNSAADADDVEAVTRKINGNAMTGLEDRRILTARAKTIFVEDAPLIA